MADLATNARLIEAVRQLMTAAATSEVPPDELQQITASIGDLTGRLAKETRPTPFRSHLDLAAIDRVRAGEAWPLWTHNPLAIPLDIKVSDGVATSDLLVAPLYEGPPGLMHGGMSAAVLDSLLAVLAQVQRRRVVTVRLEMSYLAPIPLGSTVHLVGEITASQGRKTTAVGEIRLPAGDDGQVIVAVRAEALLLEIPGAPD
ncbi:PaaI family thioesterase [Nocardioides sp. Bht2]|uniref:PaaI family thioesterase n=1 Tax=Nocardioides sp. Bht2 TaxID=3392297 RepID=UPI0039B3A1D5